MRPPRVALVGASAHGRTHLRHLQELHETGRARLAAVCDLAQPDDQAAAWLAERSIPWLPGFDQMMAATAPDVVVIATPPHLHAPMLRTTFAAGADALVEKPPVVTVAQLDAAEHQAAGHLCQVGFQALGSWAGPRLRHVIESGELGRVDLVSAAGCWARGAAYYGRAPWAGRRVLDGAVVGDGALTNPFAHALMSCLDVAGVESVEGAEVTADLYQAHGIEAHDTGSVRIRVPGRPAVVVACTLCAATPEDPWLLVRGDRGRARWDYLGDTVEVRAGGTVRTESGPRVRLLDDLVDVRAGEAPGLLAPLARTRSFVQLTEWLNGRPVSEVPETVLRRHRSEADHLVAIAGVETSTRRAAEEGLLYRETGSPWTALAPAACSR